MSEPAMEPVIAYVALGSNLNDPIDQVQQAFAALRRIAQTRLLAQSPLYRSQPLGPHLQADFINAVAHLETQLSAEHLLLALQDIEHQQGRERSIHWGPRTLDLDLLLYGQLTQNTPTLTLPHPGLTERDFVLYPLADIAPALILPNGIPLASLVAASRRAKDSIALLD